MKNCIDIFFKLSPDLQPSLPPHMSKTSTSTTPNINLKRESFQAPQKSCITCDSKNHPYRSTMRSPLSPFQLVRYMPESRSPSDEHSHYHSRLGPPNPPFQKQHDPQVFLCPITQVSACTPAKQAHKTPYKYLTGRSLAGVVWSGLLGNDVW